MLVITSVEDGTANLVIEALNERHARVVRVDPADIGPDLVFGARLGDHQPQWIGRLRTPGREIALEEVGAVYYRRPTPYTGGFTHLPEGEREFPAVEARYGFGGILRSLHATYVNHPAANARADYKPAQLQMAAQLGLTIPPTLITNDVSQARAFAAEHGPIIYKSFRGAPGGPDGYVAAIWTQRVAEHELDDSVSVTAHLFQKEVPKIADARVTVIGPAVFASRISSPDGALDWRSGDWEKLIYDSIDVPEQVKDALHTYLDHFGLVFGCFDFALEAVTGSGSEAWTFIECNPNGQWGWLPDSSAMADAFADVLLKGRCP
ncbi:ATP-grasp ribosomal peptide maturase [Streptosporangium subroseum]|uniref:ATP-grasp ribosomal peptide maturase n=1 Tax=Streptosporangium subroseum TaxID=106412 RepID=UPI00308D7877|nr:ATP-grasp ribosomal peptide maturase [Streptosporangium subroseum]